MRYPLSLTAVRTLTTCMHPLLQMIEPLAKRLAVPSDRIIANVIRYDDDGNYASFDPAVPTSHDGGKGKAMAQLKERFGYDPLVMIGDGATDLQARPPADLFIGFGGNVVRDKVKSECDWWVMDFKELLLEE